MKIGAVIGQVLLITGLSACGGGGTGLGGYTVANTTNNSQNTATTSSGSGVTLSNISTSTSTSGGVSFLNAQGLWRGSSDTNRGVISLILDNTFYWVLYSAAGDNNSLAGVVVGNSVSTNGVATSSNGKDFNFETGDLFPLTWQGSYVAGSRLQAILTYTDIPGAIVTLNTAYDNHYNAAPNIASLSGRYTGSSTSLTNGRVDTAFTIFATGQISGSRVDGCTFSGVMSPRTSGNAYTVSLSYGTGCSERNIGSSSGSTGSAYFDPNNGQLYSVTLNSTTRDVLVFVGNKQ